MASDLPPEQYASYSAIIDQILAASDLNTISAKRIRKGLQEKVEYDITPHKAVITDLIMERFDKFQREQQAADSTTTTTATAISKAEPAPKTNGVAKHIPKTEERNEPTPPSSPTKRKASSESDDDLSDIADTPPPKKAKKSKGPSRETDEEIAKRIQAELNAPNARSTRGGGAGSSTKPKKKKAVVVKKTPKKKSKAKLNSDDDSELEGAGSGEGKEKVERERKGGFHKPMALSEPLGAMLGETQLSRPQTVKRIWAYVKERDLQDPSDKRQIRCDEAMRAVFKQDKVHMFTMNKLLAAHLYAVDE